MKKSLLILVLLFFYNFSFSACWTAAWTTACDDGTVSCNFCHAVLATNSQIPSMSVTSGMISGYIFHCCPGYLNYLSGLAGYNLTASCHCTSVTNIECSSASSGINGTASFGNDSMGQAIINRDQIFETGDWANDNMQKWEALEARALAEGFSNMTDFARANPGATPFDIFAIMKQIKCLDDGYYDGGAKPAINTLKESPENNNAGITSGKQVDSPKWNEGITPLDDGGVYIGNGTTPMLLRDKDSELTDEEAALLRINSVVDTGRVIIGNTPEQLQAMQEQTSEEQKISDERSEAFAEGMGIVVDPGKEYYAEKIGNKFAGETGVKIFGVVMTANGMFQDLKQDNKLGFLNDVKNLAMANLPEVLGNAVGTATITTGAYLYAVKQIGIKTVDVFNNALISLNPNGSGLTGGLSAAESLAKTLKDGFNKTFENAGMQLKYLKEGKDTEGNFKQ